jgi:hypothetical protein
MARNCVGPTMARNCVGPTMAVDWGEDDAPPRG